MCLYQKKNKNKRKCSDIQSDTNTQEPFLNAPRFRNDKTLIFYDWKFNVQLNQQIEWYPIIEIDFEKYGHKNHSKFNTYFHLVIVSLLSHLQKKNQFENVEKLRSFCQTFVLSFGFWMNNLLFSHLNHYNNQSIFLIDRLDWWLLFWC